LIASNLRAKFFAFFFQKCDRDSLPPASRFGAWDAHKQLAIRGKGFRTQARGEGRLSRRSAKREGGGISAWMREDRATKHAS
jgi:hypothetical protein